MEKFWRDTKSKLKLSQHSLSIPPKPVASNPQPSTSPNGNSTQSAKDKERVPSSDSHPCTFQYNALRHNEIRLLRCSDKPADFQLSHVSFDGAPDYIALSYFWGDPNPCQVITCNGQTVMITENLSKVLATVFACIKRQIAAKVPLFEMDEDIFLWADGICINQNDAEEKNKQIVTSEITLEEVDDESDPGNISQSLWDSPWFFRSWVTQEAVLSKHMICMFGDEPNAITFSIDILGALVHQAQIPGRLRLQSGYFDNIRHGRGHPAVQVYSWCQLRSSIREQPGGINLVKVLDLLQPADATDKRDKVYSTLGILKQHDRQAIKVNYAEDNTVENTYTDLAKYCISTSDCMRMLEHAGTKRQITNMPTWVPDWSYRPRFPLDSRHYRAAGDTISNASVSPCGRKIITKAFPFDKITVLGLELSYPEFRVINGPDGLFQDFASHHSILILLEETCQQFCKAVQTRYNRNPGLNPDDPLDQIISRTLTADRGYGDRRANLDDVRFYNAFMERYPRGSDASNQPIGAGTDDSYLPFQVLTIHCQRGRKICLTQAGLLGLVPDDAKVGDWISILPGGNLPFVLRNKEGNEFEIVGHAYVHGAMDGEVLLRFGMLGLTADEIFSKWIALI